ncbi:hypothetical protein PTKIN_Ptkin03bG0230400 [Pterospermum kingtungense]
MVLRDSDGAFLACQTQLVARLPRSREGEAMGLAEALSWLYELGLQNVVVEVNAKEVADAVYSIKSDLSEFGSIISRCRGLLSMEYNGFVHFARR